MKQRVVFKLVFELDGIFYSSNKDGLPEPFVLQYKIGVKTIPKIGRIFAFDTLQHAVDFIPYAGTHHIFLLKGIATEFGRPNYMAIMRNYPYSEIMQFWGTKKLKHRLTYRFCKTTPPGSLSCSSFTPNEIVGVPQ